MGMQRPVEDETGVIAGEWPAGPVCAVHAGRETDDEQPMARAPEWWNRAAMVIGMLLPDLVEEAREAWAQPAEGLERCAACLRHSPQRALNCASSVEPRIAVIDDVPAVTVCVTSSKYPAPTSR